MGALSLVVLATLAAGPSGAPPEVSFDGPTISAAVNGSAALLRVGDAVRVGEASAFLKGQDRVSGEELTYGDAAQLWVRFQAGREVYRVELDAAGFPPEQALRPVQPGSLRRGEGAGVPAPPPFPVEGGVVLGGAVGGKSEVGPKELPRRRAEVVVFGVGRVFRNDERLAARARIQAQLVPAGVFAPEGSLRRAGGEGDPELHVIVDGLPQGASPGGRLHFVLDGALPERRGAAPFATIDQQWESGEPMLAWRDEGPGRAGEAREEPERAEEGEEGETRAAAPAPAPGAPGAPGVGAAGGVVVAGVPQASGVAAPVPALPNTAPIQYVTPQSTPSLVGVPVFGATPGAPPAGTPGAPPLQTPSAPGAVATAFGPSQLLPIDHSSGLAPRTPVGGGVGFAGPGLPATPTVLNDGRAPFGIAPSVVTPTVTPQPANAQPVPLVPGSAPAMPGTNPFTGLPEAPATAVTPGTPASPPTPVNAANAAPASSATNTVPAPTGQ